MAGWADGKIWAGKDDMNTTGYCDASLWAFMKKASFTDEHPRDWSFCATRRSNTKWADREIVPKQHLVQLWLKWRILDVIVHKRPTNVTSRLQFARCFSRMAACLSCSAIASLIRKWASDTRRLERSAWSRKSCRRLTNRSRNPGLLRIINSWLSTLDKGLGIRLFKICKISTTCFIYGMNGQNCT